MRKKNSNVKTKIGNPPKKTSKTLEELTGYESGIVVYPNGNVIVCNFRSLCGGMPTMLYHILMGWGEVPKVIKRFKTKDVRDYLPDQPTISTDEDGTTLYEVSYSLLYDLNDDILRLYHNQDAVVSGKVWILEDDTIILCPEDWE